MLDLKKKKQFPMNITYLVLIIDQKQAVVPAANFPMESFHPSSLKFRVDFTGWPWKVKEIRLNDT